jgi:hypothetical protein
MEEIKVIWREKTDVFEEIFILKESLLVMDWKL